MAIGKTGIIAAKVPRMADRHDAQRRVLDAKWRVACRMAAERRVMEESAISGQSRELWRLLSVEHFPVKEAAKRLGMPANTASKIKRRIEARIFAILKMYE